MAITPVQPNIDTQKTYRDAKKPIKTTSFVHPHAAEGHLVHDSLVSIPKFWMKDIAYDMKAVRDGFNGKAKDHQTGRLNDVGLKLGGIGIASYLASQTTDPKMRIMEYVGLGAFLACMQLYPMIAINGASRLVQGYDIGKEYIDDQGRKKSVFQDGNYIPYDMYRGEYTGENLDIIGDRMGIPRGIKNRDELTKEQMRKIAIQNNTLWMLGAGFATPVMTALLCCGAEQILSPAMEMVRNRRYNSKIASLLHQTQNMTLDVEEIESNKLSSKVEKLLNSFKDKELPKEEFNKLVDILANETDENLKEGIREDLEKLFKSEKNGFVLGEKYADDIATVINESSLGRQKATFKEIFNPTKTELEQALKNAGSDGKYITEEQLKEFKGQLKQLFKGKIEASSGNKNALYMQENIIIENISKAIQKNPSSYVSEKGIKDVTDLAKVLGDFKENDKVLDKCKSFKVEYAPETVLARSYKKFENTIFEVLNIQYKDLKQMKESEIYTKEILEKKIQALVSNEEKYNKAIKKLAKVMSETEEKLHGEVASESQIKDLINAIENNYNNTAKRIDSIGKGRFSKTINKLVKEDVETLSNKIKTREDLFEIIDGVRKSNSPDFENKDYGKEASRFAEEECKGVGSSKNMRISRIVERIQGVENGQRRLIHTLDYFKREVPKDDYGKHINETIKDALLGARSSDHTLKLHTDNNPQYYKDLMNNGWATSVQDSTKEALKSVDGKDKGSIYKRFETYLKRFHDVIGNNDIDFKKPDHKFADDLKKGFRDFYGADSVTRMQKFNLVAQNPIDFFKKAAKTRFENQKWLRIASGIGGSVLLATILAQFSFGRIKNPHNIQKQVSDDKNN